MLSHVRKLCKYSRVISELPLNKNGIWKQTTRSTTVLCIRKDDEVVMVADGQVTVGSQIVKPNVRKVRKINNKVLGGFAGATADAFTLFDALEVKLEEHGDQIVRAAVELAKKWRTDKYLGRLDAVLLIADNQTLLEVTGAGDVIEPHDGIMAIGSGGNFALAAARALIDIPGMSAREIAEKSMKIAADSDIYSNHNFLWETLNNGDGAQEPSDGRSSKETDSQQTGGDQSTESDSKAQDKKAKDGKSGSKKTPV